MDALEAEQVKPASSRIRLPFGFAKRHGVLLKLQADEGCDFDFLVGCRGAAVPAHSH